MRNGAPARAALWLTLALTQPPVARRAVAGYEGDDFWTLSTVASPAVAVLVFLAALALIALALGAAAALSNAVARLKSPWPARLALDLGAKAAGGGALIALTPQLFYEIYRQSIPGLPAQIIARAPEAAPLIAALSYESGGRLADHALAATIWTAALLALWRQGPRRLTWRIATLTAIVAAPFALRSL